MLASGNEYANWAIIPPEKHPEMTATSIAEMHGCPTDNSWTMMDCLREAEPRALRESIRNCSVRKFQIIIVMNV